MNFTTLKPRPAADCATTTPALRGAEKPVSQRFAFPADFKWGAATAAFQIEGGASAGGRGPSVWDAAWAHSPERFFERHSPTTAADFYHRYADDVAMMRDLGLRSFRFSLSWSRILPTGRGQVNAEGIAFYDKLIDLLLANNIEPLVDLYHWDLPQALAEQGAFGVESIVGDFERFARICFDHFSDRVRLWSTLNEPSALEHFNPFSADNASPARWLVVNHHALMMHYAAVRAFRTYDRGNGEIGAVIAYVPVYPRSTNEEDLQAADRQQAMITERWLAPMLEGTYPRILLEHPDIAQHLPGDYEEQIAQAYVPMDFVGLNYYTPSVVGHEPGLFLESKTVKPFAAQTDYGFVNYPQGLFDAMMAVTQRYNHPVIYITENGIAHDSTRGDIDMLADDDRIAYLREHLREVHRCLTAGADIRGYYYWSLLDTFESTSGYRYRFGLTQIDFDTLKRTRRKSWYYYQRCIADNAVE